MITPIFKLNRNERWRPQPAETAEQLGKIDGQPFTLASLTDGVGKRMDFPATMTDPTNTPVVGYHRVKRASYLYWHQFWLWYLYNPWSFGGSGVGRHEGDWEFVQLGCTDRRGALALMHLPPLPESAQRP